MDNIPVLWYIIGIPASAGFDVINVRRLLYIVDSTNTRVVGLNV